MPSPEEQFPAMAADAAANPNSSSARLLKNLALADAALEDLEVERSWPSKTSAKD
jgi:hypothetical protein